MLYYINARETQRGNQQWTIQRHCNIGYTRHRTKKNKAKKYNTTQKIKKMSNKDPIKKHG